MSDSPAQFESLRTIAAGRRYPSTFPANPLKLDEVTDVNFEPNEEAFEVPKKRPWGAAQRAFFGLDDPYQMCEDPYRYTSSRVITRIKGDYLSI